MGFMTARANNNREINVLTANSAAKTIEVNSTIDFFYL